MKISFVIPAFNEEARLADCLASIKKELTREKIKDAEIIVVNNASTDQTKEVAKQFEGVQIVDEPRKGIVWARRTGYLASTGELIANVDADTMLRKGWVKKAISEFEKDNNLVALSGPFIYYDLPAFTRALVRIFYGIGFITYIINHYIFHIGAMLQGGNFIIRRNALEKIGGYDTSIEFYGEDSDVANRLGKIGKVKWTFKLPIYASGRRLKGEGVINMGIKYALNHFWITVFGKPFSQKYKDIRTK